MTNTFLRCDTILNLPKHLRHGVVAIGNFDGIHLGHQALLDQALDRATALQCPAVVLTFEPHPRTFFNPAHPVDRLTPASEKAEILRLMGYNGVVEQRFDNAFAQQSAQTFIEQILVNNFAAREVVAGYNFHFGYRRSGSPSYLQAAGEQFGFKVILVPPFRVNGQTVSSSAIRDLLVQARVKEAATLLGYRYSQTAPVIRGARLGRTLGFPTANMRLTAQTSLAHGIYAVRCRRANGELYDGVASFGRRPTVEVQGETLLETSLFDFTGDLYGESLCVSFFDFLRGEKKFPRLELLVEQMKQDASDAKTLLQQAKPLSRLDKKFTFDSEANS